MCIITHVIQSCFSDAAERTRLTHLILLYAGKLELIFNRFALHESYFLNNQHDPFKSKPLQIVYIRTQIQEEFLNKVLSFWDKIVDKKIAQTKNKRGRESNPVSQKHLFWLNYSSLIGLASSGALTHYQKIVVVGQNSRIEGVCYSQAHLAVRHIRCMLTAPWNHIQEYKFVKGVGSAFIEHAALQSLKQQRIDPDAELMYCCLKRAIVQLNTIDTSFSFYTHLFFVKRADEGTEMILTGENIVKFFERFGGRAQCRRDSIAI